MDQRSTSRSTSERGRAGAASGHGRTSEASTAAGGTDDALVVGEIRGPHGVRGEVRIDPRTDVPDRFAPGTVLLCDGIGPLTVKTSRGERGQPIVRFEGVDSREAAEKLKDHLLRVERRSSRTALAPGSYLWADLVGLAVEKPDGEQLGSVRDLLRAGGADVLVVERESGGELLLPMVDGVVRSIDLANRRIVAAPQEELE